MASAMKRRLKAAIIRWEFHFYTLTALLFVLATIFLYVGAPTISTTTLAAIQLFTGLTATIAASASAIKSNDDTR